MKKTFLKLSALFCSIIMLFALFSCGEKKEDKSEWQEIYCYRYERRIGSDDIITNYIVNEETYQKYLASEGRDYASQLRKQLFIRFESETVYIKIITWGNEEEIVERPRDTICYVDYL